MRAEPPPRSAADTKADRAETAPPNPETARLLNWVGSWALLERHFDAAGTVVSTAKGQEDIVWILDKHAIRRSYAAGESGFRANGALTWNVASKRYEGVWFDNRSTAGPTQVRAEWNDDSRTMVYSLESIAPDGTRVAHRCVEQWLDEERRSATTYLVKGDTIVKRLEVDYRRTTPCPAKQEGLRMLTPELENREDR